MTTCARLREALLEADRRDLAGEGETELAVHVRGCPRCSATGRAILRATARLDEAFASAGRHVDVDAVLARARHGTETTRRRRRGRRWIALAAAAVAALIVLGRREPVRLSPPARRVETPPLVESSDVSAVAVMRTRDPDITILWFFRGG